MDRVMSRALKQRAVLALLFLSCLLFSTSPLNAQQWASDMFAEKAHNFGKVPSNSNTQFVFEFTNKYRETVHVASVRSTCGCTIPSIVEGTVESRKTGRILATFNTTSFTGPKSATVTVVFDKPFYAEVQLIVSGEILSDVNISPSEVAFGQVTAGEPHTSEVRVSFLNRPNIRIEDVRSLFSDLKVRMTGPVRTGNRVDYNLSVTLSSTAKPGEIGERLTLVTNDPTHGAVVVGVTGNVRPPVEVKPDAVHFDSVVKGKTASERLLLRADNEFAIKKVDCPDSRFKFELPEGSKKVHFLKMTFTAKEGDSGEFKVPVKIETDLGESTVAMCLVTGNVAQP